MINFRKVLSFTMSCKLQLQEKISARGDISVEDEIADSVFVQVICTCSYQPWFYRGSFYDRIEGRVLAICWSMSSLITVLDLL